MIYSTQKFLHTLFDAEDETCFGQFKYDIELYPARIDANTPFFSINAMKNKRSDANVTKHRTFLIEFDKMPLADQLLFMRATGLPVTATVFSGNKSYHFFITLKEPVTAEEYATISRRLHLALPAADKSVKNPSRFARLPGAIRPDTKQLQFLEFLGSRIPVDRLLALLPELPPPPVVNAEEAAQFRDATVLYAQFNPNKAMEQLGIEGRNDFFFWLGQRLIDAGLSKGQRHEVISSTYNRLQNKSQFPLREALAAARL